MTGQTAAERSAAAVFAFVVVVVVVAAAVFGAWTLASLPDSRCASGRWTRR